MAWESIPHTSREEDVMGISAFRKLVCAEHNSQNPLQPRDGSKTTKWTVELWEELSASISEACDGERCNHSLADAHFNLISSIIALNVVLGS